VVARLLAAARGHDLQGSAAASPRPADLRHDVRHADPAAPAVRLCIDTDPHHLPTAVLAADQSQITRTILSALSNTGYMRFTHRPKSEAEANELLQSGEVQFVVTIPSDFTRRLVRGERAQVLIDAGCHRSDRRRQSAGRGGAGDQPGAGARHRSGR